MILILGVNFICFVSEELIIKALNRCVLHYLCFTFVPIELQKGRDVSHCWDGGFVLLALAAVWHRPLTPRFTPLSENMTYLCRGWHPDIALSEFFNAGKPPSKIFHNLIIPFGFSPPLSDKCQPLYLGWPGLVSPARAPTSTYPHNLLVNVADLILLCDRNFAPLKKS